jgi:lipopolysaccharide transport system ATP-binding protein
MSTTVIRAEGLGKKYTIGHQNETGTYISLRDVVAQNVRAMWDKAKDLASGKPLILGESFEEVWALRDVNFEIREGEAVGIIGRNGAGKSTLLKILSRITEPSAGRVTLKGRVASLLEVGTGFHPELSGRENIYLNGAILGMTRREIKRKFDEIVAFSEVERYLDTPVKRYSSGMYVRLAFAVAAHLEPEILVVDEVLAVGDAEFQKKCLGKMGDVASEGRTVLFVSHNLAAIISLCPTTMLVERGTIKRFENTDAVISHYLNHSSAKGQVVFNESPGLVKTYGSKSQLNYVSTCNSKGETSSSFYVGENISIKVGVSAQPGSEVTIGIGIFNAQGQYILHFLNVNDNFPLKLLQDPTSFELNFRNILNEGEYSVTVWLGDKHLNSQQYAQDCISFTIENYTQTKATRRGQVILEGSWSIAEETESLPS